MDPKQSSKSSTECDRCQENIQKRCQVEEENKNLKRKFKEIGEMQKKQGESMEKLGELIEKAKRIAKK